MPLSRVPEPWHSFLTELDETASGEVYLHCLGGFVITLFYGFSRTTADIDTLAILPSTELTPLLKRAARGQELHRKYKVYLDFVTISSYPCDYEERLTEMFPGAFKHLRLFALDPYDLVLSKLGRNIERDREDAKYMARVAQLDLKVMKKRYEDELRPYAIGNLRSYDLTLRLWMEMIEEDRQKTKADKSD